MLWLWMITSVVALLIKCVLFFYTDIRQKHCLIFLLSAFFLLNLFELLTLFRFGYDLQIVKLYHAISLFCTFYIVRFFSSVSQSGGWINHNICLTLVTALACYLFFTDHIVLGVNLLANGSVTHIAGTYYFIIQLYFIVALLYSLFLLIRQIVRSNDYYLKARCTIALLSFIPTIIAIFVVIELIQLGYLINMAGVLSLTICLMLLIFISLSDKHKLFAMMSFIPFSRERSYRLKLKRLLKKFHHPLHGQPIDMKTLLKELEVLLIEHTQHYFSSQKELARILNISESNLSRKVEQINKR